MDRRKCVYKETGGALLDGTVRVGVNTATRSDVAQIDECNCVAHGLATVSQVRESMGFPSAASPVQDLVIMAGEQGEERTNVHECLNQRLPGTRFSTTGELHEGRVDR